MTNPRDVDPETFFTEGAAIQIPSEIRQAVKKQLEDVWLDCDRARAVFCQDLEAGVQVEKAVCVRVCGCERAFAREKLTGKAPDNFVGDLVLVCPQHTHTRTHPGPQQHAQPPERGVHRVLRGHQDPLPDARLWTSWEFEMVGR